MRSPYPVIPRQIDANTKIDEKIDPLTDSAERSIKMQKTTTSSISGR